MKRLFLFIGLLLPIIALGQDTINSPENDSSEVKLVTDMPTDIDVDGGVSPKFQGDLGAYFSNNLKYPLEAKKNSIQGIVSVLFYIDQDGAVKNAEVVNGIGYGCDEEAIRIVEAMPKWKPASQNGKSVNFYIKLNVTFRLTDVEKKNLDEKTD